MRIFVAIEIPTDIREEIHRAAAPLGTGGVSTLAGRDCLHITIKFFGETDEDGLERIKTAVKKVAERRSKTVKIAGFGCFPDYGAPRVVWAGITQGGDFITETARALDRDLRRKSRGTSGAFVPHVTVARIKNPSGDEIAAVKRFVEGAVLSAREFKPSAISVVKSTLAPSGPVYETVFSAEFGGGQS